MNPPDARDLAIGLSLGTIGATEAIAWADAQIMELDPPYWLIEISTFRGKHIHDLLKLLPAAARSEPPSDAEFLGAMAVRVLHHGDALTRIVSLLMDRFCYVEWTEQTDVCKQIYLIDDELDWNPERARRSATSFLSSYLAAGKAQMEKVSRLDGQIT
jgi:hypothetical protein